MVNPRWTQKLKKLQRWMQKLKNLLGVRHMRVDADVVPRVLSKDNGCAPDEMKKAIEEARQTSLARHQLDGLVGNTTLYIEPAIDAVNCVNGLGQSVLRKVTVFADLIERFSDIHPYAKIAFTVLLAGVKVVAAQMERDKNLDDLLNAMDDMYELVIRAVCLEKYLEDMDKNLDEYRKRLLKSMSLQTIQCAYFIRDHRNMKNFWIRAAANAIVGSHIDAQVNEFTQAFRDIRRLFTEHGALESEIRMVKILGLSSDIQTTIDLLNLYHIRGAGLDSSRGCLPGTRVETLYNLIAWVNDFEPHAPGVQFLLGGAGTGKSSVAHSIGGHFRELERLGSFIRFDRSLQTERPLWRVIPTIARNLGNWDPTFRQALANAIHDHRELEESVDMVQQWNGLILEPLKKVALVGPVAVVIDAFDECSSLDSPERNQLLKLLTEGSKNLPPNVRILITSRSESDVALIASARGDALPHITCFNLDTKKQEATQDIERYVRWQLAPTKPSLDEPLLEEDIRLLVTKAEGLFQWAATACRAVLAHAAGLTLRERFDMRLGTILRGGPSSLDDLYRSILEQTFDLFEPTLVARFRSVMAQLLCAASPLSINSLDLLRRLATGTSKDEISLVVEHMGPLLSGVSDRKSPIVPLHTSFRDFLTNQSRSKDLFVDLQEGHTIMVLACFRIMNTFLKFNICQLETSYVPNRDISDLDSRLSQFVPQALSYAACNWKDHLISSRPSTDLRRELETFLREKLLFWVELLSLLNSVNCAASSLEAALRLYDKPGSPGMDSLHDAIAFIRRFAGVISHAACHVYLSALAFSPSTEVRRNYLPTYPSLPLITGTRDHWPQAHTVLYGHSSVVYSVTYSPDGGHVASGSYDKTIRIWDPETGKMIHKLSFGSKVHGLAFSPDGRHIATALEDRNMSIWDSVTGDPVLQMPCESEVWCIAYSPDGHHIACSGNGRICVWNSRTFEMIHQLRHGHQPIQCIAFSPSNQYIVSGSRDSTLQIWNAITGEAVGSPLEGHTENVSSVLFSLDGRRVVSGSWDTSIRVWDFETGQTLATNSLTNRVLSLSLSCSGKCLVCGGDGGSILIWDIETCRIVRGPFVGHTGSVFGVSFSPDGQHIASGSDDGTVRIWSVETSGDVSPASSEDIITTVAFSPDGSRIVSGSFEGTIGVWDAETGKSICSWRGHSRRINRIRFSPNGSSFASASDDEVLRVWNSTNFESLGELREHTESVTDVDYSPDGRRIVSSSADNTLHVMDADSCTSLFGPLVGHDDWVRCVAWSPDGTRIASGSSDHTVIVWNAETGCAVGEPLQGHENWVKSVSWYKDGQNLMTSDDNDTVIFWDLYTLSQSSQSGRSLHAGWCTLYSPDHQLILSGALDGAMKLWDAQTREPVGNTLNNPFGMTIQALAFSPDGRRIATTSAESRVCAVWDVNAFMDISGPHPSFLNFKAQTTTSSEGLPKISPDGWVTDMDGNLLIWVPDEYRDSLLWRGLLLVIPEQKPVVVDFADAFHGTDWAKCHRENNVGYLTEERPLPTAQLTVQYGITGGIKLFDSVSQ